jgi:hypothetical protein
MFQATSLFIEGHILCPQNIRQEPFAESVAANCLRRFRVTRIC